MHATASSARPFQLCMRTTNCAKWKKGKANLYASTAAVRRLIHANGIRIALYPPPAALCFLSLSAALRLHPSAPSQKAGCVSLLYCTSLMLTHSGRSTCTAMAQSATLLAELHRTDSAATRRGRSKGQWRNERRSRPQCAAASTTCLTRSLLPSRLQSEAWRAGTSAVAPHRSALCCLSVSLLPPLLPPRTARWPLSVSEWR